MAHKLKEKHQGFGFQTLLRVIIFLLIVFFLINYFAQKAGQNEKSGFPSVLGDQTLKPYSDWALQQIPPESRQTLQDLPHSPAIIQLQGKISEIQNKYLDGFPDKQIKEIQKAVIKDVSNRLIENIDKK